MYEILLFLNLHDLTRKPFVHSGYGKPHNFGRKPEYEAGLPTWLRLGVR